MNYKSVIVIATSLLISSSAAWANGCLTPASEITAKIASLGPNPGGLEQVEVHVHGFKLAGPVAAGCTIGLGVESQILSPPAWAVQRRAITKGLAIVDPNTNAVYNGFFLNPVATLDFNGETMGLGYFSWPMPVWFMPLTTSNNYALNGSLPQGEVVLVFDVLVKPQYTVNDFVDDLIAFGHVASDFSYTDFATGATYLFWSSNPMVTQIDQVDP